MAFRVDKNKGPTVFPLVGVEATDMWVTMSVMASSRKAKLPRAYRNLHNKTNIQGPEDYWNRISGRSSEQTTDFTYPTLTRSIESLLPAVSSAAQDMYTGRGYYHQSAMWIGVRTGHEVG